MSFIEIIEKCNLEKGDAAYATVIKETFKGALMEFNGTVGFAYTSLSVGETALVSVRKIDMEREFILLNVDSVFYSVA